MTQSEFLKMAVEKPDECNKLIAEAIDYKNYLLDEFLFYRICHREGFNLKDDDSDELLLSFCNATGIYFNKTKNVFLIMKNYKVDGSDMFITRILKTASNITNQVLAEAILKSQGVIGD